jgi:uncharacterized protein involved in propanediol utilization
MTSIRVHGHFGEFMQGRLGPAGPVALVTIACSTMWVDAHRAVQHDPHGLLPPACARKLLEQLSLPDPGPVLLAPTMPRGGGAGASTAALVAYARLAGSTHDSLALARACVAAEGASDPLMFAKPDQLLWASRLGEIVEPLPPVPTFDVIGGFYGPNSRTDPTDSNFPDISDLVGPWRQAASAADQSAIAGLAGESANRCLRLRKAGAEPIAGLAKQLGALGHVIAHTGSARGLLFAPGTIPSESAAALMRAGFRRVTVFRTGRSIEV